MSRWTVWLVLCALALLGLLFGMSPPQQREGNQSAPSTPPAAAQPTLIRGARVFDGEQFLEPADVLLADGLITRVAPSIMADEDVEIVNGHGRTLLPGLIDSHVHVWGNAREQALRFGVTSLIDMFSDPRGLPEAHRQRESLHPTRAADLWSAGLLATAAGGHGSQFGVGVPPVNAANEAAAWVAARKGEGSDFIKLVREDLHVYVAQQRLPSLDADTAAAVIAATHEQGLRAVVHASAVADALASIEAGADGLVHVPQDLALSLQQAEWIHERGAFVVPTLSVIAGFSGERTALLEDPRIAPRLDASQRATLAAHVSHGPGVSRLIENARASVRELHTAGVRLLAGTDAPNPNTAQGASLHEELALLVGAGLSPAAALAAATSVPADAFDLHDRGRIAAGLRADLILVDGDPGTDIRVTRSIVTIWKNGAVVDRRPPETEAAPLLESGAMGGFDQDAVSERWFATSDGMRGGRSEARIRRVDKGAAGSAGALQVSGRIDAGQGGAWAGAMFAFADPPMQPVDAGSFTELRLWLRGDGRDYRLLLFAAESMQSAPIAYSVTSRPEWQQVRVPLSEFAGADLAHLRALAVSAGLPEGEFEFAIDQVEIR